MIMYRNLDSYLGGVLKVNQLAAYQVLMCIVFMYLYILSHLSKNVRASLYTTILSFVLHT